VRTLVVYCHPDPDSFTAAVLKRVLDALAAAGHDVRVSDLYADGFDPIFSAEERRHHLDPGAEPSVERYTDDLRWCEHLVLVYPTWWSGQPAMLKGWLDRVWVRGVAWDLPPGANRVRPMLHNIHRLSVVTSHGSSKWLNALQGEPGKRTVMRTMRSLCSHRAHSKWVALYDIDRSTDGDRQRFLDRVSVTFSR
jgi:NAD(P)H dehydrogenase (quinone)